MTVGIAARRRDAADALRADQRSRLLFDNAAVGVIVVDGSGRILQVNRRMCEMLAYTEVELLAMSSQDITYPDDITLSTVVYGDLISGAQTSTRVEKRYLRKDGSVLPVVATVSRIDDVTARRAAEEALHDLNRTLERHVEDRTTALVRANKEMEAFSYAVSHDLRAPLRAIHGFSVALVDDHGDQLDAEGRHCVARIRANTLRMSELIDGLLSLSRLTGGAFVTVPVDLADTARGVIDDVLLAHPGVAAKVTVVDHLPAVGDPSLLRTVLVNLLDNAVKFCGAVEHPRIVVGGHADAGSTHLFVEDNGAGFDSAHAERLFAPFQRLHEQSQFVGVGVGLATVYRIVSRHGGRVWAEGAPDRGATFHVELPGPDQGVGEVTARPQASLVGSVQGADPGGPVATQEAAT